MTSRKSTRSRCNRVDHLALLPLVLLSWLLVCLVVVLPSGVSSWTGARGHPSFSFLSHALVLPSSSASSSRRAPASSASSSASSIVPRRTFLLDRTVAPAVLLVPGIILADPTRASAAPQKNDCYTDCTKNCQAIAPKNVDYCQATCQEYCDEPDRNDGLSGSASDSGGEVGILGGTFGTGTVVKGDDKPPSVVLPGLDFTSAEGKKLIGY